MAVILTSTILQTSEGLAIDPIRPGQVENLPYKARHLRATEKTTPQSLPYLWKRPKRGKIMDFATGTYFQV